MFERDRRAPGGLYVTSPANCRIGVVIHAEEQGWNQITIDEQVGGIPVQEIVEVTITPAEVRQAVRAKSLDADAPPNATTTGARINGLTVPLPAGTYVVQYWIRYRSQAVTTGVKFGVQLTGAGAIVATLRYQESTTAASTGAASQSAPGGRLVGGASARTWSTTAPNLGPTASVDAANADMLAVVEALVSVTSPGDLELWHASEVAAASQVKAGTSLIVTRTGS